MNKTLKFKPKLIPLIFSGAKRNTWRLFDDKDLAAGDIVDFLNSETKEKFTTAKLKDVIEKSFGELDAKDWEGHEKYANDQEMYAWYTKTYSREVTPETKLKIVWFDIT